MVEKDTMQTLDVLPAEDDEWVDPIILPITGDDPQHRKKTREGLAMVLHPDDIERTHKDNSAAANVGTYAAAEDAEDVRFDVVEYVLWATTMQDEADFPAGVKYTLTDQDAGEIPLVRGFKMDGVSTNVWHGELSISIVKTTHVPMHFTADLSKFPHEVMRQFL